MTDVSLFRLTKEKLKALIPYLPTAEKAFKLSCISTPVYQSDFTFVANELKALGWNVSLTYSCNSCVVQAFATLYRVLSHECNAKAIEELTNPQPKPEPKPAPKPQQKSKNVSKKQNAKVSKK